jgi:UDP-N-acetylglucosamine/UDP-N-acetylgalactosamine diphosphorylase
VEYSDLPEELANARTPDGELVFSAGSIAVHAIELTLAERVSEEGSGLPYHRAVKRVPYLDAEGRLVEPDVPNAIKFEAFIFGALPLANRVLSVETLRSDEFSPIKNASGDDSPESARRDLNRVYARWLECAGASVRRDADGDPTVDIEIDPRFALDAAELVERLPQGFQVTEPLFLDAARDMGGRTAPA